MLRMITRVRLCLESKAAKLVSVMLTNSFPFFGFPGIDLGTRETIFLFLLSESKYLPNYKMSHSRTQQH